MCLYSFWWGRENDYFYSPTLNSERVNSQCPSVCECTLCFRDVLCLLWIRHLIAWSLSWNQIDLGWNLGYCVVLGEKLACFEPQFLHLYNGDNIFFQVFVSIWDIACIISTVLCSKLVVNKCTNYIANKCIYCMINKCTN